MKLCLECNQTKPLEAFYRVHTATCKACWYMVYKKTGPKRNKAETIKKRYGDDYFKKIGQLGGKASTGGFALDPELAREAGRKGGKAGWTPERRARQSESMKASWRSHRRAAR